MSFFHGIGLEKELPTEIRKTIVRALGPSPVCIDDIIQFADATPGEVQLTLLELDLAGRLERHPGGLVSIQATRK